MRRVLTCSEVEELLGAYALDALPPEERARVQEHLEGCAEHQATAEDLQQVAPLLALTADELKASPELRQRILDMVRSQPQSPEPETGGARQLPAARRGLPRATAGPAVRPPWWEWRPRVAALVAAGVLLLAVGVAVGRLITPPAPPQAVVAWTFTGNSSAPNATAHLVYFKDQQQAVLDVSGLPALTPGQVYELWLFKGSSPIDAGVASTNGQLVARLDRNLGQYQQIAITIEPGEQPQPTTNPVLVGRLS